MPHDPNFELEDHLARSLCEPKDKIIVLDPVLRLIQIPKENFQFNSASGQTESVNCLRLFGKDYITKCHKTGLEKEANDNIRAKQRAEGKDEAPKFRKYTGFATSEIKNVLECSDDHVGFEVLSAPQVDNPAHCNIKLNCLELMNDKTEQQRKKFKNGAIVKLARKFNKYEKYSPLNGK